MINNIINAIKEIHSHVDIGMLKDIEAFLVCNEEIFSYNVKVNEEEEIIIDIKLKKFTVSLAKNIFARFVNFIGYGCLDLSIKDELTGQIKYLYVTSDDESLTTKMKIVIN